MLILNSGLVYKAVDFLLILINKAVWRILNNAYANATMTMIANGRKYLPDAETKRKKNFAFIRIFS